MEDKRQNVTPVEEVGALAPDCDTVFPDNTCPVFACSCGSAQIPRRVGSTLLFLIPAATATRSDRRQSYLPFAESCWTRNYLLDHVQLITRIYYLIVIDVLSVLPACLGLLTDEITECEGFFF